MIKEIGILTAAVAIIAAAVYFFLVPSHASVSSKTTFRIIVIADSGSGIKLDTTMPRPEILLTDAWLGTRKK